MERYEGEGAVEGGGRRGRYKGAVGGGRGEERRKTVRQLWKKREGKGEGSKGERRMGRQK